MKVASLAAVLTTSTAVLLLAGSAEAQSAPTGDARRVCAEAASAGQVLRDEGKLKDARAKFVTCAQPTCPKLIQKDCAQWQADVDERLPTVVVGAKDDVGKDVLAVTVTMDGKPFASKIDGHSVPVDPGSHRFHFEAARHKPADLDVVVREGERARAIDARLERAPDLRAEEDEAERKRSGGKRKGEVVVTTDGGGVGPLPWILGGLGVAGLGAGVFFTVSMFDEANGCKPKCTDSEISSIKTKNTLEIVSYAAGGALVVGAVVVAVVASRPSATTQEAVWVQRLRVGVVPGGATGALHFSF